MKYVRLSLLSLVLTCSVMRAEDSAKPEPFTLKNRSSFTLTAETRAPFWPIGWVRTKGGTTPVEHGHSNAAPVEAAAPQIQLTAESFNLTSVLLGNPSLVTINGRSFEEGEFIPVISGQQRLKVQVRAIREDGVWLQLDKQDPVLVPMRRGALRPKTAVSENRGDWAISLAPPAKQ